MITEKLITNNYGQAFVGFKDSKEVWVNLGLIYQHGLPEVKRMLGMSKAFPVITDLSGNQVMVEADSHQEAISLYIKQKNKVAA